MPLAPDTSFIAWTWVNSRAAQRIPEQARRDGVTGFVNRNPLILLLRAANRGEQFIILVVPVVDLYGLIIHRQNSSGQLAGRDKLAAFSDLPCAAQRKNMAQPPGRRKLLNIGAFQHARNLALTNLRSLHDVVARDHAGFDVGDGIAAELRCRLHEHLGDRRGNPIFIVWIDHPAVNAVCDLMRRPSPEVRLSSWDHLQDARRAAIIFGELDARDRIDLHPRRFDRFGGIAGHDRRNMRRTARRLVVEVERVLGVRMPTTMQPAQPVAAGIIERHHGGAAQPARGGGRRQINVGVLITDALYALGINPSNHSHRKHAFRRGLRRSDRRGLLGLGRNRRRAGFDLLHDAAQFLQGESARDLDLRLSVTGERRHLGALEMKMADCLDGFGETMGRRQVVGQSRLDGIQVPAESAAATARSAAVRSISILRSISLTWALTAASASSNPTTCEAAALTASCSARAALISSRSPSTSWR